MLQARIAELEDELESERSGRVKVTGVLINYFSGSQFRPTWTKPVNKARMSPTCLLDAVVGQVIVRPLSTVGYTSVAASAIHSRQWYN